LPPPPHPAVHKSKHASNTPANAHTKRGFLRRAARSKVYVAIRSSARTAIGRYQRGTPGSGIGLGGNSPFLDVETETLNGTAEALVTLIEDTEGVHVAFVGAPVQDRFTVPVKPSIGVSCRLYVAVWPALTVADAEPLLAGEIEKPGGGNVILATNASPFPPFVDCKAPAVASPEERLTPVIMGPAGLCPFPTARRVSRPMPVPMSPALPPK
jgi:hypothetical protein